MEYERMDELIDRAVRDNNNDLFYYVNLPLELINSYKDTWVTFLSDFSRYIIHQLLVCVSRDGHQRNITWYGTSDLRDVLISSGHVRISPHIVENTYTPIGGRLDYLKLVSILKDKFVDNLQGSSSPCHLNNLLSVLCTTSHETYGRSDLFITFFINHPCLLSCGERVARYLQYDHMITNLVQRDLRKFKQYLNDTFGDPPWIADISWVPDMWKTYNYSPNNNSTLWTPRYTLDLNSCSHFARNFLNHFGREVSLFLIIILTFLYEPV